MDVKKRFDELILELCDTDKNDYWLDEYIKEFQKNYNLKAVVEKYNRALCEVEEEAWIIFKQKLIAAFNQPTNNRGKYKYFSTMNEAFAYKYLKGCGFSNIEFVPESEGKTADIRYLSNGKMQYCEVKTINISEEEIQRLEEGNKVLSDEDLSKLIQEGKNLAIDPISVYGLLNSGFFKKLDDDIKKANDQIANCNKGIGIIFFIIHFDDFTNHFLTSYTNSIEFHFKRYWNNSSIYLMLFSNENCIYKQNI